MLLRNSDQLDAPGFYYPTLHISVEIFYPLSSSLTVADARGDVKGHPLRKP